DADTGNLASSPIFRDDVGVGGNGDSNGDVTSGPFAFFTVEWASELSNPSLPLYRPHYINRTIGTNLARNRTAPFAEDAFNTSIVNQILSIDD
ncbi:hypothetical protein V8E36_005242, partial [Tilletia maclaganii]